MCWLAQQNVKEEKINETKKKEELKRQRERKNLARKEDITKRKPRWS